MNQLVFFLKLLLLVHSVSAVPAETTLTSISGHLSEPSAIVASEMTISKSCVPSSDVHPINITASCSITRFPLSYDHYREFAAEVEFDPISCNGLIHLNISINNCEAVAISRSPIPGGSVLVINGNTTNLLSGNRLAFNLRDDELSIQSGAREFKQKSECKFEATKPNGPLNLDVTIKNSQPTCRATLSLDPQAKHYVYSSNGVFVFLQDHVAYFIVGFLVLLLLLLLLTVFLCLWRSNRLNSKFARPRRGIYDPRAVEDSYPNAYPVHFKPADEPVTRSPRLTDIRAPPTTPTAKRAAAAGIVPVVAVTSQKLSPQKETL
ncbi:hypothetical protein M3Y94_01294800 [Aphelenchoides besseyi]|nr:hypothetical protein M3Y94_01294800 [Aphelenchoides besseyi]